MISKPLLSIDEFAYHLGHDRWGMHQVYIDRSSTVQGCSDVVFEDGPQAADSLSREEIGQHLMRAEKLIADYLGFWPAPVYTEGEPVQFPGGISLAVDGGMVKPSGKLKSIFTKWRRILYVGVQTETTIEAGVAATASDPDSDGINELITITTAATVPADTQADEIVVYFTDTDRLGQPQDQWQIRPLSVTINTDGTLTITGPAYLFLKPAKRLALMPQQQTTDATNFVTEVDVARRYIDTTQGGTLKWMNLYGCDEPPCTFTARTACFHGVDNRLGEVIPRPATYDASTDAWTALAIPQLRSPDQVTISYLSGYPRMSNGWIDLTLGAAITALACALMPKRTCGCDYANKRMQKWQEFPSEGTGNRERTIVTLEQINSLWGGKNGALEAFTLLSGYSDVQYKGVIYGKSV